jgi:crotonobetainyl-CoA hydratase
LVGFSRAIEMMLSGEWVEAEEALEIGLIRQIVPQESLMAESRIMAHKLMEGAPLAQQAIKQVAYRSMLDPSTFQDFWSRLDRALYHTEDHLEGARSFTEKRQPIWKGH